MLGGVKALEGGGEGPFVELAVDAFKNNLRPPEARQLAARLYVAARAAERITAATDPRKETEKSDG